MSPVCETCGSGFEVPESVAAAYPGWIPKQCPTCYRRRGGPVTEDNLSTAEVLARYHSGPQDGVFTDGSANPNPGPGGWGAVYVVGGEVVDRRYGHEPHTTNNRMELTAIAAGLELIPEGRAETIYTDSRLAVDTLTRWAEGWERRGWARKGGPIQNLDLIRPLFAAIRARPEVDIEWIAAHSGHRWNEYADALSTAYLRDRV